MKLAHCATILIGTLSIGGGLAQAQDPWDPQGQGTHLQRVFVPGLSDYDSFYIQSTLNKPGEMAATGRPYSAIISGTRRFQ